MTLKLRILKSLVRLFIILVRLTKSWLSEKMPISNRCISGLMSNSIKKSWTVSISYVINVEKKSTFLDLLLVNVVCEWPIRSAHSHKFITISFNHKPIVSVKLSKPQWNKLCQKNIYSMLQESRPTQFSRS